MLGQFRTSGYAFSDRLSPPVSPKRRGGRGAALLRHTVSSCSQLPTNPPIAPPTIGATQNSQSDCNASAPPKIAVAVERAGLSEAFETGMATRWNRVSASPMAIGAKPAGQFLVVTHMMTIRNSAVITISISATETSEECVPPYRLEISVKLFHLPPAAPERMTENTQAAAA